MPNIDLKSLPEVLFLLLLLTFPFVGYFIYEGSKMEPIFALGLICMVFAVYRVLDIYRNDGTVVMPYYLILYALFMVYAVVGNSLVDPGSFMEEGLFKVMYSNPILLTFYGFFIVENTRFPKQWLRLGVKILMVTLVLGAIASLIQVQDPFFFQKSFVVKGLSFEQLIEYYQNHGHESTPRIRRFLTGYRNSVFSYINLASVGIDGIAIFSLLFAMKAKSRWQGMGLAVLSAVISFLSSSRWIMLNFLVVATQSIWLTRNKALAFLKYVFYTLVVIFLLVLGLNLIGFDLEGFVENRLMSDSADTRFLAFEVFFKVFPEHPILGTLGTDTEKMVELLAGRSSQIHVGYLKLFYYYGLIGGLMYLAFLASLLLRLWKRAKASGYWGGFYAFFAFARGQFDLV